MFHSLTDGIILENGVKIPCVGYGTWQLQDGQQAKDCVRQAIEAGYRHVDTADDYANEMGVGQGVRSCGVAREEIFVTTKHWITNRGYEKTIAAFDRSLQKLGLDYVDLYLIHWPAVAKAVPNWEEVNADTWRGFEKLYRDGKIRAIGVSNFLPKHLDSLIANSTIKPMVDQIEFHPGFYQPEAVEYCKQKGIAVEAWSPLGMGRVLTDPLLTQIAAKYGKSVAQLCIRFALQQDVIALPKTKNPAHIIANTEVFDFEISVEDMAAIQAMPLTGFSECYPDEGTIDFKEKTRYL